MNWFERKIRRYEHRRWTTDDNRRVQPFHWGLEHIGGTPNDPNPRAFLREYARNAIEHSTAWYAASPATDYHLDVGRFATAHEKDYVLTFPSPVPSNPLGPKTTPSTHNSFRLAKRPVRVPPSSSFPTGTRNGTARTGSAAGFNAWESPSSK